MLERWITIISGAAFSPFIYFAFVAIGLISTMTIQFRINNIYNNNYYASAIRHNILRCGKWQKHNIWAFFSNAIPNC